PCTRPARISLRALSVSALTVLSTRDIARLEQGVSFGRQKITPFHNSIVTHRREGEELQNRLNQPRVGDGRVDGEWEVRKQVGFADNAHLARAERLGILSRFVVAFRRAEHDDSQVLAKVMRRRTDQVADVFDKEEVKHFITE